MAEKKTQQEILDSHTVVSDFIWSDYKCPQCEIETWPGPSIENEDEPEELPQMYCEYGCGYMFLNYKEP